MSVARQLHAKWASSRGSLLSAPAWDFQTTWQSGNFPTVVSLGLAGHLSQATERRVATLDGKWPIWQKHEYQAIYWGWWWLIWFAQYPYYNQYRFILEEKKLLKNEISNELFINKFSSAWQQQYSVYIFTYLGKDVYFYFRDRTDISGTFHPRLLFLVHFRFLYTCSHFCLK